MTRRSACGDSIDALEPIELESSLRRTGQWRNASSACRQIDKHYMRSGQQSNLPLTQARVTDAAMITRALLH